jgi:exocyst complex protein 7
MPWEALEREIPIWIKAVKECASIYFVEELKLAEAIFSDYSSISSSLFSNLIRTVMIQLLNFAEGVAMTKRSAEKLFKFLDMYETLRDSLPAMGALFSEEYENELKTETTTARCRIGEAAIYIFCDLENSIKSDTGKTPVPGGAVHPLTLYTMNYLKYGGEYKATLEQVFREHSKIERADSTSRPRFEGETQNSNNDIAEENQSPFSNQLMRVMDLLDSNLGAKSKLYKDIALSCIFMMNNGRYIVQKIKGSTEIHQMIGDTWCRRKSSELRNYHKNYQRETWSKLLSCLGHEGLQVNGKVIKPVLKERFKSFNMLFDEIHKTQSSWVVSDDQLQSELRVSISAVVIPAYRSFLGRFSQYLTSGRQSEKYIKYQAEDLETSIDELFDGNPASVVRKRP